MVALPHNSDYLTIPPQLPFPQASRAGNAVRNVIIELFRDIVILMRDTGMSPPSSNFSTKYRLSTSELKNRGFATAFNVPHALLVGFGEALGGTADLQQPMSDGACVMHHFHGSVLTIAGDALQAAAEYPDAVAQKRAVGWIMNIRSTTVVSVRSFRHEATLARRPGRPPADESLW